MSKVSGMIAIPASLRSDFIHIPGTPIHIALESTIHITGIRNFGETPVPCGLLDGLFLAVNTEHVLRSGARFDSQFMFHFYDLDFCRTSRQKGLSLGTWPIRSYTREW